MTSTIEADIARKLASVAKQAAVAAYQRGYARGTKPTYVRQKRAYAQTRSGQRYLARGKYPRPVPLLRKGKDLKTKVKNLSRKVKATEATHVHRTIESFVEQNNSENIVDYGEYTAFSTTTVEAAMANLRYYDPATPGTLVTADGSTGTFHRDFSIDKASSTLELRANYHLPVNVVVYAMSPREDTSLGPNLCRTNGLTDQMAVGAVTSPVSYPTDSEQLRKLWKIEKSWKASIYPGNQRSFSITRKPFTYDPSNVDSHALTYQKQYGALVWYVRMHGELGHDITTPTQVGLMPTGMDVLVKTTLRITYDAGTNLEDYSISQNLDSFGNFGVLTNKPIADNQAYGYA